MYYILNTIQLLQARLDTAKDRGATATEYAMLVAFIAVAMVIVVTFFGHALADFFGGLGNKIGITNTVKDHTSTTS
jgi:pilus assembly protein Flp/PilA